MTNADTENSATSTVEIDLELEDWGRLALIAHRENLTIEKTIEYLLRMMLAMEYGCNYSEADEEAVVRLAQAAEAARSDPGENLTGLSDGAFIDALTKNEGCCGCGGCFDEDELRNPDSGC